MTSPEIWRQTASDDIAAQVALADPEQRRALLRALSTEIRINVVRMISRAGMGHIGGDFSIADILATLFFGVLRHDPRNPSWPLRDRFILSKGHCAASLYATLALRGYFPRAWLDDFMAPLSPLNGHPNRRKVPGVEANTGPLGHGLPVGVGCAIAARQAGQDWRTFVATGDGELQEGSNWEAAMAAGHRGLSSLTVIVDRNRLQQGAGTEVTNRLDPLDDKWRSFGWDVSFVDGHDHVALYDLLRSPSGARPRCIIANTVKGKGVSFLEGRVEWHHKVPSPEQTALALAELSR